MPNIQGTERLRIVLDMTDTSAPKFLVYDSFGHLMGGIKDVTVNMRVDFMGDLLKTGEVTIVVDDVEVIGDMHSDRKPHIGTSFEVNSRGDMRISQRSMQYLFAIAGGREAWDTAFSKAVNSGRYNAIRTMLSVDSNGHGVAKQQGMRVSDCTWEDIPDEET